jgi:hypothetical protein
LNRILKEVLRNPLRSKRVTWEQDGISNFSWLGCNVGAQLGQLQISAIDLALLAIKIQLASGVGNIQVPHG